MGSALRSAEPVSAALASRWREAQLRTDALFELLQPCALYDRPVPERHRLIFYLGHLEAFDWNLLAHRTIGAESFHPAWDKLFAFGIDPIDGQGPRDQPKDWPAVEAVREYNQRVRETLSSAFERAHPEWSDWLHTAIEHRLMHAETLAYLLHALPLERKLPQPPELEPASEGAVPGWVAIPSGVAQLGRTRDTGFGWDNEFEALALETRAFAAGRYKVGNGEFLEFVRDGGYGRREFWSPDDWAWREAQSITRPHFWTEREGEYRFRGIFGDMPLTFDWPVWVSHAEASAYARWAGVALPTEAQWHRMAYGQPGGGERPYPWGEAAPAAQGNFDLRRWNPAAGNAHPQGASAWGVEDLLGNGWEWTRSAFAPWPGFAAREYYAGYSADFFDGHHFVLRGGSPRTAACMLRRGFRNWFQPHYPYLYAGFRCVKEA